MPYILYILQLGTKGNKNVNSDIINNGLNGVKIIQGKRSQSLNGYIHVDMLIRDFKMQNHFITISTL